MSLYKKFAFFCFRCIRYLFRTLCRFLPVSAKKIVISNYTGRGYGDNPKYIVEELLKRGFDGKIIWLVKNKNESVSLPFGVLACNYHSLLAIYHLSTAKIWIDNCRKAFYYKKKGQKYLQTWHGFALKRIEKDVVDKLSPNYERFASKDSRQIDIIVSDSAFMTNIYRNSFFYDGEIVEWGAPRNDILVMNDIQTRRKVFEHYGISDTKKIVLYAPTFRVDGNTSVYSLDICKMIEALNSRFNSDFAVLVRLHPNIADKCEFIKYDNEKIINSTFYPDMQELLDVADVIISDYSSLMFDYVITKKPCFIFATDISSYKEDRNFYFPLESTPFPISQNNEELICNIKNFDGDLYRQNVDEFLQRYNIINDGQASSKCADWIYEQINK